MGALFSRPVTSKLTLLMALSSGIALLLSCTAFVVNDVAMLRTWKANSLREMTAMLAAQSSDLLRQGRREDVRNLLGALRRSPRIQAALVYDHDEVLVAGYPPEAGAPDGPLRPEFSGHKFSDDGYLDVVLPITADDERLGTIHIRSTVGDLRGQIHHYIAIAASVMMASLSLAIVIGSQLQRFISQPIVRLAETVKRIKIEGDYSIRVSKPSDDEIGALYDEFNAMLVRIDLADAALQRAHEELREANNQLERRVRARTEELSRANARLIEASRQAGMAEVANGVLHNVGNVLNSVNVATALINEAVRNSEVTDLSKVIGILEEHQGNLAEFHARDPRGDHLASYLIEASRTLVNERSSLLEKLQSLNKNIDHIKAVVSTQQSYAGMSGVEQVVALNELLDDAMQINSNSVERHDIEVCREYVELPPINVDKQKVLQILINLIRNAIYAVQEADQNDGRIALRIERDGNDWVTLSVIDNGTGITEENMQKIFRHGFTTKREGHGFGLHSAALAAKEMGGSLTATSEGLGRGAAFLLKLPLKMAPATIPRESRDRQRNSSPPGSSS